MVKSERYKLIKQDAVKIGKGALLAGSGAAAIYIIEALSNIDFGDWTAAIGALLAILANVFRKWLQESKY